MRKITFKESSLSQKPKTYNLKNTYVIFKEYKVNSYKLLFLSIYEIFIKGLYIWQGALENAQHKDFRWKILFR